ncbi:MULTISPECIES: hypothetical protein [unclassified Bacteroides]|uniref:hypothetical protein n=1 Tax=unclassified Bacteroides TaxID=2646097 RepID=UPI000B571661|nr:MULTISPECIES: hypothetical protein [unclassified Bacteroides]OUN79797.1 hypothetical protein B5G04_13480 [Bacteroides sp. An51A]OUP30661.1 hypothetical protein B5F25_13975 [Bacteroides sp. An19]
MDKKISQMTREEKLQALTDYHACKRERHIIHRYVQALRREDAEQTAYFESFGESVHHIVLNVNTYERRLIFGYVDRQFNEYGWISGMLPIVEEIRLDNSNVIHIGQSVNGTYVVTVGWCTGTAGGGSHPSVWEEPIADYKEAVASGIRQLERIYNDAERRSLTDRGNYNPKYIRRLKAGLQEVKRRYTAPQQLSLF